MTVGQARARLAVVWTEDSNRRLLVLAALFLVIYVIPWRAAPVEAGLREAVLMLSDYVREHVLLCLVPAFLIAGALTVFLNDQAVVRHLGPDAPPLLAFGVASVSGTVLAVCSCTVLPIFRGIYRKGAGIGPAISFLYAGPAINVLALILTARVLGASIGIARVVGAVVIALVVGLTMQVLFRHDDHERVRGSALFAAHEDPSGGGASRGIRLVAGLTGLLLLLNWASTGGQLAWWDAIHRWRFGLSALLGLGLLVLLFRRFSAADRVDWLAASRDTALRMLPLLLGGVLLAGFLLGHPGERALIAQDWIASAVGSNSFASNIAAGAAGALMYVATLTEVPIMHGFLGAGMHPGPGLALLLAGPSVSLPSLLVIGRELGPRRTLVYAFLVISLSAVAGQMYGSLV